MSKLSSRSLLIGLLYGFFLLALVSILILFCQNSKLASDNKDIELNNQVNRVNDSIASRNPYGFTDRIWPVKKSKGVYRIAVTGDSFIWGDGLPHEKAWGHKLRSNLAEKYDSVEVMNWGKCGWSTLDEFNFLRNHGCDYAIDLLIIGWVDNDPDVGRIQQIYKSDAETEHPWIYRISPALAENMLNHENRHPYDVWLAQIYSKENLQAYQLVLDSMHQYLWDRHIPALLVMTPGTALDARARHNFDVAKPLLLNAGFECLDLYGPSAHLLDKYTPMQMQANAVNGHPGDVMTETFAKEVQKYLEQHAYFKSLSSHR
ncbi:MAG: hypothetical protein JST76_01455 [Bacteroidetes bacterium]|nr:hypothetical protein [Bacteroidota bacterium]